MHILCQKVCILTHKTNLETHKKTQMHSLRLFHFYREHKGTVPYLLLRYAVFVAICFRTATEGTKDTKWTAASIHPRGTLMARA